MLETTGSSPLDAIVGTKLVGVSFIQDYIGFQFDDLMLHALSDPILIESSVRLTRDDAGYRDALCRQIEKEVSSVVDSPEQLEIILQGKTRILVPLDVNTPPGPELATLSGRGGQFFNSWLRQGL